MSRFSAYLREPFCPVLTPHFRTSTIIRSIRTMPDPVLENREKVMCV